MLQIDKGEGSPLGGTLVPKGSPTVRFELLRVIGNRRIRRKVHGANNPGGVRTSVTDFRLNTRGGDGFEPTAICVHPRLSLGERSVGLWSASGNFTEVTAPEDLFVLNSVLVKPVAHYPQSTMTRIWFGWLFR